MTHRRRFMMTCFSVLVALAALCLSSCPNKTQTGQVTIVINSTSFSPGNVTVLEGTLVTWINNDSQPHTATAVGAFDSGPIAPNGGRWTWVAAIPGTFAYHSLIQPNMAGTLTVTVNGPSGF